MYREFSSRQSERSMQSSRMSVTQPEPDGNFDYDLIVVGNGAGGLSAAQHASAAGKSVAILDYTRSSQQGMSWRLGGTCLNVGCIPKKIMHQASILGDCCTDAMKFGWEVAGVKEFKHDWITLKNNTAEYISNQSHECQEMLDAQNIKIINAYAEFINPHEISATGGDGKVTSMKSRYFLLAMGSRPKYPAIPGAKEYCIPVNDLFSLNYPPGSTLIIGATSSGMECAGFLNRLGMNVTVIDDKDFLEGFDRQMTKKLVEYMTFRGVKFISSATVVKIEEIEVADPGTPGKYLVTWRTKREVPAVESTWTCDLTQEQMEKNRQAYEKEHPEESEQPSNTAQTDEESEQPSDTAQTDEDETEERDETNFSYFTEEYNTVMISIGREPNTAAVGLDLAGVELTDNGYVVVDDYERTTSKYIYAVGDLLLDRHYTSCVLMPVARQTGKLIAKRLFEGSTTKMDYIHVPQIIYGPVEYGCVGVTEEDAIYQYGAHDIEVYHTYFQPLEWVLPQRDKNVCYAKIICVLSDNERVLGFHVLGPNAGEMTQGFQLSIKLGATKEDLDHTMGLHPTCAEVFTTMTKTKRSGIPAYIASC